MLIDDPQVAINEIIVACQKAADHYANGADLVHDESIKQLFVSLGAQRRTAAERLSEIMRDLGSLPREADIEQEQLQMLWSHLMSALSGTDSEALLNEMIDHESEVRSAAENALGLELEQNMGHIVQHIQKESSAALQQLREITRQ